MRFQQQLSWIDIDRNGSTNFAGVVQLTGIDAVINSVMTILQTRLGERVMLPTFGMSERLMVGTPLLETFWGQFQQAVTQAIQTWDDRVRVLSAEAVAVPDNNQLTVKLILQVVGWPEPVTYATTI